MFHATLKVPFITVVCLLGTVLAEEKTLIPNGTFSEGLEGWVYRPGDEMQVSLVDGTGDQGTVLELHSDGKLLGVETERLVFGETLAEDQAYEVLARLKHEGLESGVFAFSMYCFDEGGKSLKQISFYGLNNEVEGPHDWKQVRGTIWSGQPESASRGDEEYLYPLFVL